MTENICSKCKWWVAKENKPKLGYCYRYPSQPVAVGGKLKTTRPLQRDVDFCSEWEEIEQ